MPIFIPARSYKSAVADWRLLRDCDIGERAIKEAGQRYLRKLSDQTDTEYEHYLERAMFPNITRRTVDDFTSMVLHRDIEIELPGVEDLTPELDEITHEGQPFTAFAAKVIRETILMGRYGALVDAMPDGSRVYIAGYPTESILNVRTGYLGGIRQPTMIALEEVVESWDDPYAAEERRIYRTLEMVPGDLQQVYQQNMWSPDASGNYPDVADASPQIAVQGQPVASIPFVFFGAKGTTSEVQRSPMLDIALLNLHLYRFLADLNWGLHFTALPTPVISGAVGTTPGTARRGAAGDRPVPVWELDAGATATMLEFTGSGLTFLENAVKNTQDTMRVLGARMISTGAQGSRTRRSPSCGSRASARPSTSWSTAANAASPGCCGTGWRSTTARPGACASSSIAISATRRWTSIWRSAWCACTGRATSRRRSFSKP
jgi:hypothetical protein